MEEKGDKKPGDLSWGKFYRVFQGDAGLLSIPEQLERKDHGGQC